MTTTTPPTAFMPPTVSPRRQTAANVVCGICGFLSIFGIAHLLLVQITKLAGYVFFGVLALVPPLVAVAVVALLGERRQTWPRYLFGMAMCALAVPAIYFARFAPEASQQSVRNLLGVPFFVLAIVGPFWQRRTSVAHD